MFTLELPKDIEQRLHLLAARTGKPSSFYVEAALRDFLDGEEDFVIATQRLAQKQPGIPSDEVEARLGLEG
jgi:RHH-type rel operon transcriptional repressor/antitoxin RelB